MPWSPAFLTGPELGLKLQTMRLTRTPALLLSAALGILSIDQSAAQPVRINGIAAKVNGRVITVNEIQFQLRPILAQLEAQHPRKGPDFRKLALEARDEVLDEFIDREIILDEYSQLNVNIPDHIVEQEMKRLINQLYDGDKAKLNSELKASGLTMNGFRKIQKKKMIVQAMRQQHMDDAAPPLPNEIYKEYNLAKADLRDVTQDKVTFHKIFIPAEDPRDPDTDNEVQLALAEELVKDIKGGKDMAELAKTHSKDAFADKGGFQEDVPRSDLSVEFAAIIFDAKVGDVIGPLTGRGGYTIVKPSKIDLGPAPPLSEVREVIESRVRRKKSSAQFEAWMEKRRKRAMVDVRL